MTVVRLAASTLDDLDPRVEVPHYDRRALSVGVVHFGVGGFHRAHQAMYLDRLMNANAALDWAIAGVGLLPADRAMHEALSSQDGLYTLVEREGAAPLRARVVGSLARHHFAPDDPARVLAELTSPGTRIVSLTITEGGYNIDPITGAFDLDAPAIRADAVPGALPTSVFGYLVEALARRRAAGVVPFTVVSCDNIQSNGAVARRSVQGFASLRDEELAAWIGTAVAFPNSMVDRITPVTTPDDIAELASQLGVEDAWPVVCEPFTQWVLEDSFVSGRPPLELAGVQLTSDVGPYEKMKLRLLNASHQALAYSGYLSGYRYAHDAAADPVFEKFLRDYMAEARPTLDPVPGIDLDDYCGTLIARFANPGIRDTIARLCAFSSDRIPKWVLPVIRDNLAAGRPIARAVAIVASWARYAEGRDEQGRPIALEDARRDEVMAAAQRRRDDVLGFVRNEQLFGDLARVPEFASLYEHALGSFVTRGARRTLELLNESGGFEP